MRGGRGWARSPVCLALLAAVAVGCGSGGSGGRSHASEAANSSPASRAPSTRGEYEQALTAYRDMWQAVVRVKAAASDQTSELQRYASGQALQFFVLTTQDDLGHGWVAKGDVALDPQVVSASPTKVRITDCVDASKWLRYRISDGGLKDNTPGGHHSGDATVLLVGDRWTVDHLTLGGVGTC